MNRNFVALGFVWLLCVSLGLASGQGPQQRYAELSPFSAVRWKGQLPEVLIGQNWFGLSKIDEQSIDSLMRFCSKTYSSQARKRFGEDLVEVLSRMGHAPKRTSALTVQHLVTGATLVIEDVAWTNANRSAVRDARLETEESVLRTRRRDPRIAPTDPGFAQAVERFMATVHATAGFSGAVIIAKDDQVIYEKAFGHSDIGATIPNTLDTPFRIASLSKQFTAAAILRLQQDGRLKVTESVGQYLPRNSINHRTTKFKSIICLVILLDFQDRRITSRRVSSGIRFPNESRTPPNTWTLLSGLRFSQHQESSISTLTLASEFCRR